MTIRSPETACARSTIPRRLRAALLGWYDRNARPLPWRSDHDSYRIWVAEVMLQQTRVQVVIPAYRRFLRAFPTLARLARAHEERVLSLWSGLGYYSRARSLHRAARILCGTGEADFPATMPAARKLPGVGAYIASAVLSIAYEQPYAAVDGNVNRVLSRLFRLGLPDGKGEPQRALAQRLLDRRRPGDWNQAMMELGETVCLPRAPRCDECPLSRLCAAAGAGQVSLYPPRRPRREPERVSLRMTVVCDRRGRVLLERGAFPYLPHLWLPPIRVLTNGAARSFSGSSPTGRRFRHVILHRSFDVEVRHSTMSSAQLRRRARARAHTGVERRLFDRDDLDTIGRSSMLTKGLRAQ